MTEKRSWREAWLTPIGAMVFLLVINLGVTSYLAFGAREERAANARNVSEHRVRNEEVHEELKDFILCIAEHPPGDPERVTCIDLALAGGGG